MLNFDLCILSVYTNAHLFNFCESKFVSFRFEAPPKQGISQTPNQDGYQDANNTDPRQIDAFVG